VPGWRAGPRFPEPRGWERYERLLRLIERLDGEAATGEILASAGLAGDPRGGIGGLHAASAIGLCHAHSGGRRRLIWRPGRRAKGERLPRLVREREYARVLRLLQGDPRAACPTGYLQDVAGGRTRQEVVGAMKLWVAAELVVYLLMKPPTRRYPIPCWGWQSDEVPPGDRYYRGGRLPSVV
jgi:hypothetical protein